MQNILIKGDYKDDEQLKLVCEALEALKVSMDPSQQGKATGNKKAVNTALFELRYI